MPRILVLVWLVVALMGHPSAGQSGSTTTTPRSADDEDVEEESTVTPCAGVLEKQKEMEEGQKAMKEGQKAMEEGQKAMEQELKSLRQAVLSPSLYSVAGRGSVQELLDLKTKLAVLETKLGAAERKLEVAETKVKEDETKLEASEMGNKLLALQTKLEIAEMKIKALESMGTKLEAAETKLEAAETTLKDVKSRLETTATALQATQSLSKRKGASTFVRWGRKTCSNTTQLVYSGVAGGAFYNHPGSAADALCLTRSPQFDSTPKPAAFSYLYGAEYQNIPNHHDHDVPCAVCRTPHSTTIMIPTTHACPAGWSVEYAGHLASGYHGHKAASEHLCLDEDLENVSSGHVNYDGYLLYYIVYQCGSLPCPPYVANKVVLCVVCSK